jgi:hypothetical protein
MALLDRQRPAMATSRLGVIHLLVVVTSASRSPENRQAQLVSHQDCRIHGKLCTEVRI